jgi:hypothetical protein
VERKIAYYPFWVLFFDDGNVEVVDAVTGEKDSYMKDKMLDKLPI